MSDAAPPTSADETDRPPAHPGRWILAATVALLVLFVGGVWINLIVDAPLTISPETTYITEPRTPDGKWVDYLAALEQRRYPPEMQTDDNGARLIVRALGPGPDLSPALAVQVYEKLGLTPAMKTLTYEEPWDYLQRYAAEQEAQGTPPEGKSASEWANELEDRLDRPWTFDDLPMMEAWLAGSGPALDLIVEAVQRPAFCFPLARERESAPMFSIDFVNVRRLRGFVRGLQARAHYRVAVGEIDTAIDDIVAAARLGRRLQLDGFYFELLVGLALEAVAHSIGVAATLDHPPSEEQLRRLMDELDQLPPRAAFEVFLETERYVVLDYIQAIAKGDRSLLGEGSPSLKRLKDAGVPVESIGFDWTIVMRSMNSNYETLLKGHPLPAPPPEWKRLFRGPRSVLLADEIIDSWYSSVSQIREAVHRKECGQNLLRITLAMLLYERRHGTLPPACTVDAQGNRLHSWRVLLLPYLGEKELFSQIHLDEPWDSPHNRAFHTAADHLYQCPSHSLAPGETRYAVVEGPGAPFDGPVGRPLSDFGPDSAHMLLVVERTEAANWMDPTKEVPLEHAQRGINVRGLTRVGLGSFHAGGMQAGLRSGGVEFLSENIDLRQLRSQLDGTALPVQSEPEGDDP